MLKAIDLFAGIGGIRLGFEEAFKTELETVFVSEIDEQAKVAYKTNFNDNFAINGDITKIKEQDIPSFDILLAGFPCQAFSLAGAKKGFADTRGTLFFEVVRIAKYHKPKVIFCENVKNLLRHDKGNTFKTIIRELENINYKVYYEILNSKDFGVPQNRERIYIVAFREDLEIEFEFPKPTNTSTKLKDILEKSAVEQKYYLSEKYLNSLKRHKEQQMQKGNGFGYIVRNEDDICGAIVCGGMGRERNLIVDKKLKELDEKTNKEFIRKLTPREWARLQGFPESFKLITSDTSLYKQLGNSVTVPVIKEIAKKIRDHLLVK